MQRITSPVFPERKQSLKSYKKEKIRMLKQDFMIKLTEGDIEAINNATDEYRVDRYARKLLDAKFN